MIACCVGGKGAGVRIRRVIGYQVFILKLSTSLSMLLIYSLTVFHCMCINYSRISTPFGP